MTARADRRTKKLARRILRIEQAQRATSRGRQLAFSDIAVVVDGEVVNVGVPSLLQGAVETDARVTYIEREAIPYVERTMADQIALVEGAEEALAVAAGFDPATMVLLVQSATPGVEYRLPTTLWINTTIPAGETRPKNAPTVWSGSAWVEITTPAVVNAAQGVVTARSGVAGAIAAADAAQSAADAAAAHIVEVETVTLTPLKEQWESFYGVGGSTLEQIAENLETAQGAAAAASSAAAAAQGTADTAKGIADTAAADVLTLAGKTGRLIRSATAPTGEDANGRNLWLDTDDGVLYQNNGTTWVKVTDPAVLTAQGRADAAWNLADTAKANAATADALARAAQSTADSANTLAGQAQSAATAAGSTAAAAQGAASTAQSAAQAAQGTADLAGAAARAAAGLAAEKGRTWTQAATPPVGTVYSWMGAVGGSASVETKNGVEKRRNLVLNPLGPGGVVDTGKWAGAGAVSAVVDDGRNVVQMSETVADTVLWIDPNYTNARFTANVGDTIRWSAEVKTNDPDLAASMRAITNAYSGATGTYVTSISQPIEVDTWTRISVELVVTAAPAGHYFRTIIYPSSTATDLNSWIRVREMTVEIGVNLAPDTGFFDGATPDDRQFDLWVDETPIGSPAAPGNVPKKWNGNGWSAVTDKAALDAAAAAAAAQGTANTAVTNAATAQARADKAVADALLAQSAADEAGAKATTADGRITVAAANPTVSDGAGKPVNALWEVRSGGTALRRYIWSGTAWSTIALGQDFIGAKAIGMAQIMDLAVGTGQIAEGAITDLQFGSANGGKLWAGSVSAREASFGMAENLIPNGAGESMTASQWATGLLVDLVDKPAGALVAFKSTAGQGSHAPPSYWWDVEPGVDYWFEVWLKADKPDSRIYLELRDQTNANSSKSYPIVGENNPGVAGSGSGYPVQSLIVPTTWTRYAVRVVPSATTERMRLGTVYFNHSAGTERTAVQAIANMRMRRMVGGTYIGPGGVLTHAIGAEQVVTSHLAADVGESLTISSNQSIVLLAGLTGTAQSTADAAKQAASTADTVARDALGVAQDATGAVTDLTPAVSAAQATACAAKAATDESARYFSFAPTGLTIGIPGVDPVTLKAYPSLHIDNDSLSFVEGGQAVAYLTGQVLHVTTIETEVITMGKHQVVKQGTTGTKFMAL